MPRRRRHDPPPGQLAFDLWGIGDPQAHNEPDAEPAVADRDEHVRGETPGESVRNPDDGLVERPRPEPERSVDPPEGVLHESGGPDRRRDSPIGPDSGQSPDDGGELLRQGRGVQHRPEAGRGGRDAPTHSVDQRPGAGDGTDQGRLGTEPGLRREPDPVGRENPGLPGLDALLSGAGGQSDQLGTASRLPGDPARSRDSPELSKPAPGPARPSRDHQVSPQLPLDTDTPEIPAEGSGESPRVRFVPETQQMLAPSGPKARFAANVAAIEVADQLRAENRPATADEQQKLAKWSSWGAIPEVFDSTHQEWAAERAQLRDLLDQDQWDAAARTTINAHYTDPLIATQMWRALTSLGFEQGTVLEPGCGAGTFIGLAPPRAQTTGIELDPMTAFIAQGIYPHAGIRSESFADTRIPEGTFDAAIGNVPFADVKLHDPVYNAGGHSMHNYFILKSLRLTRPGGLVAVLTSRYTMDAQNPAARREMNLHADLLGAIRLPSQAHQRAAGTDVVTDLLVFRRRHEYEQATSTRWETVTGIELDGQQTKINAYFDEHPELMLGTPSVRTGQYGAPTLEIRTDLDTLSEQLEAAVDQVVFTARRQNHIMTPRDASAPAPVPVVANEPSEAQKWEGSILPTETGGFATVTEFGTEALSVPKSAQTEVRALLRMRDKATRLLSLEAATVEDTTEIDQARTALRQEYQRYLDKYGPINRYTLRRTGRTNEAGDETYARMVPSAIRVFRNDPFGPLVMALENFDDTDHSATPAEILSTRVVLPRAEVQGVDTPAEAVTLSMDRTGGIDLAVVADLLGTSEDEAREALSDLAYTDPETGDLVHAPEYLSGDVRAKLEAATTAAEADERFTTNIEALQKVLPEPLGVEEITAKMGAVWISAEVHQQFLAEILKTTDVAVENPLPAMWEVRGGRRGLESTSEWGTERRPAPVLAQSLMEQKTILVHDEVEDAEGKKRRVLNPVETTAAQEKAEALEERFAEWVWEDPARARDLTDEYNRRFNSLVLRDYTGAGDYLSLPGLAANFTPRAHQRSAVARMIAEPAAGLFHEVGAGKTAEMIMGAMEMRRMGLIRKPVVVVPNHMLEQFSREWLQLYPQARILAASSTDLTADRRRQFVARASANDWDSVILTQGAFAKIPLRPETDAKYIRTEVQRLKDVLANLEGDDAFSVKRLQKKLLQAENKLKDRTSVVRDTGVSFEDTGIDYLIVDEVHTYKNLATDSNIRDASIDGSARASDLHMKLEYLRSEGKERVVTGATATPISNSITEAYVMQRYLRPDLLDKAGLNAFDAWAATFGQTVTQMEMSPTGGFRLKTRFSKFTNVPEMLTMWSVFADVKTAEDLQLPTPEITVRDDGKRVPETVAVQPTVELEDYVAALGDRAQKVADKAVDPTEDNMLAISTDGRKAALDIRMVSQQAPSGPTKIDTAAEAIHQIWETTKNNEYLDPATGQPSPAHGGLQLVFSDLGTPNPRRWNAYDELATKLVDKGMPADSIRYIHEAKTDADKARLFAAARAGHIAVLLGSTEKMGVGTNVQARAVALHHLDCPWRPSDIAQREGRILRQGNQNPEVSIRRYVTERSFDSYMWQAVERKAGFISQITRGRLDTREVEEIDDTTLSASEAKAISSGDPLLLELSTVQNEVSRLQRLKRAHQRNEQMLIYTRDQAQQTAQRTDSDITGLEAAKEHITDTSGDKFRIQINTRTYTSRTDAASAVTQWANDQTIHYASNYRTRDYGTMGTISGFDITVSTHPNTLGEPTVELRLDNVPRSVISVSRSTFLESGTGLIQRLENKVSGIPTLLEKANTDLTEAKDALASTESRLGQPFKHAQALHEAEADLARIESQLAPVDENAPSTDAETHESHLSVDDLRAHPPTLGVRPDPDRHPEPLGGSIGSSNQRTHTPSRSL